MWETSGRHLTYEIHLGIILETSGNHLGDIWETSRHLGDIWETSGSHLGAIWEPSGSRLGDSWPGEAQACSGQKVCQIHCKNL